jgi:histidyl-tRNA synthetase
MIRAQPVKGMNDLLPDATRVWRHVETIVREIVESYGYREIRLPLLEYTELFRRSIGEVTDIVEKEMYTFEDRNGESLTLRPEATAGVVRAGITNGLLHHQRQKLWTSGPMFRYERPQKGRYRQFHQMDVEALGYAGPGVDAELIVMCARMWKALGIERIALDLNSLGDAETRRAYRRTLVEYFEASRSALDEDSVRRLTQNPLRILDSKNPEMQPLIEKAPVMLDYLDGESAEHFAALRELLDEAGVPYRVNPRLVRGLDYYNRTVFEWHTGALGAQGAVCSGGRYDGLAELLGGRPTPAVGWAMGMERLVALYEASGGGVPDTAPDVYVVAVGNAAEARALTLAEELRDAGLGVELNLEGGSFKTQLRRADRSGATFALILGEDEVRAGQATLKPLRSEAGQVSVAMDRVVSELARQLCRAGEGAAAAGER